MWTKISMCRSLRDVCVKVYLSVLVFTKKTRITGKTTKYRKDHEIQVFGLVYYVWYIVIYLNVDK